MMEGSRLTTAARFGRWLGCRWRIFLRFQAEFLAWMRSIGIPPVIAKIIIWILHIGVVGCLLYVAFWVAVLLLLAVGVARLATHAVTSLDDGEWRHGSEGYGFYENGVRTDFGRMFEDDE